MFPTLLLGKRKLPNSFSTCKPTILFYILKQTLRKRISGMELKYIKISKMKIKSDFNKRLGKLGISY